jgi:hypothetical protein
MKGDLWNEHIADDVIDVVLPKMGSFATATNVWANSPEGTAHIQSLILNVMAPKVHEIRAIVVIPDDNYKVFRVFFERDPCAVLFFGGPSCPMCGGTHDEEA